MIQATSIVTQRITLGSQKNSPRRARNQQIAIFADFFTLLAHPGVFFEANEFLTVSGIVLGAHTQVYQVPGSILEKKLF